MNDTILSEKERQRAEFAGTSIAIMEGSAAERYPLLNGGMMLVIGPSVWQTWNIRAEGLLPPDDPPDRPF